jgi:hypothetical protein
MIESWQTEVTLLHVIEAKQWLGRKHDLERLMASMRAMPRKGWAIDALHAGWSGVQPLTEFWSISAPNR